MKKLFFLSATAVILTATVSAQTSVTSIKKDEKSIKHQEKVVKEEKKADRKALRKLKSNKVSYQAKQAFIEDFGNIPVTKWDRTEKFDRATFSKDGQVLKAYYDYDAELVGTLQGKTFADLPANAQKLINEKYKGFSKESVIIFDENDLNLTGMVLNHPQFDNADNYFVELQKGDKKIIVQVNMSGDVGYFDRIK